VLGVWTRKAPEMARSSKQPTWKTDISEKVHLFWLALRKFDGDYGFYHSSAIAFNLLICFVPFLLLLLSLVGTYLYSSREVLNHIRHYLETVVPSLDPKIMENILQITQTRKIVGILGIAGLLWTSTWVFSSLRTALNVIFQVEEGRGIVKGKAIDLLMIFLAGIALLMSMILTSAITFLQSYRLPAAINMAPFIQWILKYPIPFFFTFWMFFWVYKIIPRKKVKIGPALKAALFSSLLWEVAKQLFGWYVRHVGRFSVVYGSLGTITILFLWIYYSSAILLLGGEIAVLLESKSDSRLPKNKRQRIFF
jgi:membrane protein